MLATLQNKNDTNEKVLSVLIPRLVQVSLSLMVQFYKLVLHGWHLGFYLFTTVDAFALVWSRLQGLKSKCVDFTAATLMILSQLSSQVPLKADIMNKLIPVMTKVGEEVPA